MLRHWKIRAIAQKFIWMMPYGIRLNTRIAKLRSGHDARTDLFDQHARNYLRQIAGLKQLGLGDVSGFHALEIGTGWDLNVALLFSLSGFHRVTTVDVFRHATFGQVARGLSMMSELAPAISAAFQRPEDRIMADLERLKSARTITTLCESARLDYFAPVTPDYRELENDSIDVCYSTAVLEHVYRHDLPAVLGSMRRVLKPTGFSTHVIDLKDHFAYFQLGLPYNHFLRFSSRQWKRWAGNPLSYTNRLSASQWRSLFEELDFELLQFSEIEELTLTSLPPSAIHPENRHWTDRDLRTGELLVVARPRK